MPKVFHRKARKDYPDNGIKKGDMYYNWDLKTGPRSSRTYRQLTPPKPQQLTTSEFLIASYDLAEQVATFDGDGDDLEALISEYESLRDETQEKFDNMPEGLQQGDSGQLLEERVGEVENIISQLEDKRAEWGEEDEDFDAEEWVSEVREVDV